MQSVRTSGLSIAECMVYCFPRPDRSIVFFPSAIQPNSGHSRLHETFHFASVRRTPRTGDRLVSRHLAVHKHRETQTKHKHYISMPWMWFEPTLPASTRAKTFHASDCSATATGSSSIVLCSSWPLTRELAPVWAHGSLRRLLSCFIFRRR
jgi:hypothetical protein